MTRLTYMDRTGNKAIFRADSDVFYAVPVEAARAVEDIPVPLEAAFAVDPTRWSIGGFGDSSNANYANRTRSIHTDPSVAIDMMFRRLEDYPDVDYFGDLSVLEVYKPA